jgi:hypothetical protein
MKHILRFPVTLTAVIFLFLTEAQAVNRIAIKAVASEDYVKARATDKTKKIQTYQFMKGNYHPGTTFDKGMVELTFEDIVGNIAVHLQKQNYYPEFDRAKSDLIIVVHWGRTSEDVSDDELLGYTSLEDRGYNETVANAGAGGATLTSGEMNATADFGFNMGAADTFAEGNDRSIYYKAQLLGMEEAFHEDITMREELLLKTLLAEERYFVVLIAYDLQKMLKNELELLWTTRYSIRAVGQSYQEAIKEMNFVAGDYFGKNIKGLTQRRIDDKSRVEMGEIEVISNEVELEAENN